MTAKRSVFQILDLDRTLLDTAKLARMVQEIIAVDNPQLSDTIGEKLLLGTAQRASFFMFEYIGLQVGQPKLESYIAELANKVSNDDLLLPGARERIAFGKSQSGWDVGILTYGAIRDQTIKLQLVGLQDEKFIVTDTHQKGRLIASWKSPSGQYQLPHQFGGQAVDSITLDDDTLDSFVGLPSDASGQWITIASTDVSKAPQQLLSNVTPQDDLQASIDFLTTEFSHGQ
jgi:hypothetical protein